MRKIAVAFGSNLGDRSATLATAARDVAGLLHPFQLGPIIETAPVGAGREHDPAFLNSAGVGWSDRSARELLDALRAIETAAGRTRPFANAPRTLDLDLILVGDECVDAPGLVVPHPRFRERAFVLEPLAAIAPEWRDPITGLTLRALLDRLQARA